MKKYCWKTAGFNGNVQKVGEELETIKDITNVSVLEYARNNKNSELHKCFEWDDTKAGEKFRRLQASWLISSISFEIVSEPIKKQKVYVSIKTNDNEIKKYKPIKEVLDNDEEYNALLNKAKKEFENTKANYENLLKKDDLKNILFDIYREV